MAKHWSFFLNRELKEPEKIVLSSSKAAVLRDSHPKSKHHYLVVPKNVKIKNVYMLSGKHLPLLDDMLQLAKRLIDSLNMNYDEFRLGFKLEPSMQLLNMHVVSTDFQSTHLKKARHWTNFNTNVFLSFDAAYDQLKNYRRIKRLTKDEMQKARSPPFKCNKCDFSSNFFHFPYGLKEHLSMHWDERVQNTGRNLTKGAVSCKDTAIEELATEKNVTQISLDDNQQSSGLATVSMMLEFLSIEISEVAN